MWARISKARFISKERSAAMVKKGWCAGNWHSDLGGVQETPLELGGKAAAGFIESCRGLDGPW